MNTEMGHEAQSNMCAALSAQDGNGSHLNESEYAESSLGLLILNDLFHMQVIDQELFDKAVAKLRTNVVPD